ncbi:MAG: glycosyl transferase family 1 [Acidimicrobiaceae bacterium]|nr:glycosyl transferase family 1 [Acidimicrobiaceae bacterium]
MEPKRRVALVEPYLGGSHRAWAEGYAERSAHDVELFGLPAIHWKWRMQGGHVTLAAQVAAAAERAPFDAVLTTSMCNVAGLLGLCRRALGEVPVVLYMHENQLTFPLSEHDRIDLTYPMINWTSMVAADRVVFNSAYHRDEWFAALPALLAGFPDEKHGRFVDAVRATSSVLPVGVDLAALGAEPHVRRERPLVLWNQRWEYDKGPATFARAVTSLLDDGVEFDVALAGEQFAAEPPEFAVLRDRLGERLVHDGWAEPDDYRSLLRRADVVVSTAHHEFYGVAVVEAIAAGAFPVLPNRLVYPERIPPELHDRCLYDDEHGLREGLRWAVLHREEAAAIAASLRPGLDDHDWSVVAPALDEMVG